MANEKISDLGTASRLKTGNLVEIEDLTSGSLKLDVDTVLAGPNWDTSSQVLGYTAANTMEVDANSLAARLHLCPDETNYPQAGWTVGRYAWSSSQFYATGLKFSNNASVAAFTDAIHLVFAWVNVGGICVPKKVSACMATGAQGAAGTAGTTKMSMTRAFGLGPALSVVAPVSFPPSQGGGATGESPVLGSTGLKVRQPPSQARAQIVALNTTAQAFMDTSPIGTIEGGRLATAPGTTQFLNGVLYDYRACPEHALVLVPGTGFQITVTMPAGATSGDWHCFVNMVWDEWTPVSPGDR